MSLVSLVQNFVSPKAVVVEKTEFSFKEKISKSCYLDIKDRCQSHALSAKAIRCEAVKNKGNVRRLLRGLKTDAGQNARIAHVALCFLRGKKYSEVEPKVADNHRIQSKQLSDYLFWYVAVGYRKFLEADVKKFLEE